MHVFQITELRGFTVSSEMKYSVNTMRTLGKLLFKEPSSPLHSVIQCVTLLFVYLSH